MKKPNYGKMGYPELAQRMVELEAKYEQAKAASNEAYAELQEFVTQVIPQRMEMDKIESIKVKLPSGEIRNLIILDQLTVKVPPANKDELFCWLQEHNAEAIITETVNSSTLAAFIREQMRSGAEVPTGLVEINTYQKASLRK